MKNELPPEVEQKLTSYLQEIVVNAGNTGELHPEWRKKVQALLAQAIQEAVLAERARILGVLPKKIRKHKTNGMRGWQYNYWELPEGCETDEFPTGLNYVVKIIEKALSQPEGVVKEEK